MRRNNRFLVCRNVAIALLACFVALFISVGNDKDAKSTLYTPGIRDSDITLYHDFTIAATNVTTTNCSITVNSTGLDIVNGTEAFMYSRSGQIESVFITSRCDTFLDGILDASWNVLNPLHANVSEDTGSLVISDTGLHEWGGTPLKTDAPAIVQRVWSDMNAEITLNTSSIVTSEQQAGILFLFGNDFVKLFYSRSEFNITEGCVKVAVTENAASRTLFSVVVSHGSYMRLSINRIGDDFFFYQGTTTGQAAEIGNSTLFFPTGGEIGLFVSQGAIGIFGNWTVSPRVEVLHVDATTRIISAVNIPFKKLDGDNHVMFGFNTTTVWNASSWYGVELDASSGPISFPKIEPLKTSDTTPDIFFYMLASQTGTLFTTIYPNSCFFAYSRDGTVPEHFINPYPDLFLFPCDSTQSQFLPGYWKHVNAGNMVYWVGAEMDLHMQDNGNSVWNQTTRTAPAITEYLYGDFTAITKILLNATSPSHGGMCMDLGDNRSVLFSLVKQPGADVNLTAMRLDTSGCVQLGSVIVTGIVDGELWLKIQHVDETFMFSYSTTGRTYNYYVDVARIEERVEQVFEVGLYVMNNTLLTFDYWDITPTVIVRNQLNSDYYFYITTRNVPFNQFSSDRNAIQVQITSKNGSISYSNVVYVNIEQESMNGVHFLYSDGDHVNLISYSKEIIWSHFCPNTLDREYLSGNNFLLTRGLPGWGEIIEVGADHETILSINSAAGMEFDWPHDADMLPNGNILIADTGNNRIVEMERDGTEVWIWDAWDHLDRNDYASTTAHLNDVDRLGNGNTLITLRDLDLVVEVDIMGNIVWSYHGAGVHLLQRPHNADRLLNGNTIICNSDNSQVLEVDKNANVVWCYKPFLDSEPLFGWPRDADDVFGRYILISDTRRESTGSNAIYLIDKNTNETVWSLKTDAANYEADLVLIHEPRAIIKMPVEDVYASTIVDVFLSRASPFDGIYYNIYDNTSREWIFNGPVAYTKRTFIRLEDMHSYTIVAWANNSGGSGGGYPQDDSQQIGDGPVSSTSFSMALNRSVSSSEPYPGTTLLVSDTPPFVFEVDKNNNTIWSYELPLFDEGSSVAFTYISSVDYMPNGNILVGNNIIFFNITMSCMVLEIDPDGEIVWLYDDREPATIGVDGIHDADYIVDTDTILIADTRLQRAIEVDRNGTAVWEWNARNHFVFGGEAGAQFVQFNVNSTTVEFPLDASTPLVNASTYHFHVNDADRLANGNTLICMRDLNLVVEVERDGNIAWFFGNPGNTTTLKWPHNPVRLINGNTIICDSGNNRIIEVMPAKEMVWSTQSFPWIQLQFPKGAERLPNGNTLISDAYNNRNIEITSSGTIVWSFPGQLTYDADRIDRFAPDIVAAVLAVEQGKSFSIQLSGTILAADLDEAWYNVFDETRGEWLFNDMQLAVDFNQTFTLHEGNFTVHVWARDTRAGCVMDSSDFNPNVNHVLFTIALEFTPPSPLLAYIILLSSAGGASVVVVCFLRLHIIRKKDAASLAEEMKARADPASKDFTTDVTLDFDTDIPS